MARHAKGEKSAGAQPGAPSIAEAAKLVDVKPPAEELRAHVAARAETLAKLGAAAMPGGSSAARLELYSEALGLALAKLAADASAPSEEARP